MATQEVKVPDIGDFKDVPVIQVFVKAGDPVKPEDPLISLESDKATMDVPSPAAGTVKELKIKAFREPFFSKGDVIPETMTSIPIQTEDLLRELDAVLRSIDPKALGTLIHELGTGLTGHGQDLNRALKAFDIITKIGADGRPQQVVVPVKDDGIPKPLLYIGAGVLGLVLIKMVMGKPPRAAVANPSRRRRRRRHRSRRRR